MHLLEHNRPVYKACLENDSHILYEECTLSYIDFKIDADWLTNQKSNFENLPCLRMNQKRVQEDNSNQQVCMCRSWRQMNKSIHMDHNRNKSDFRNIHYRDQDMA